MEDKVKIKDKKDTSIEKQIKSEEKTPAKTGKEDINIFFQKTFKKYFISIFSFFNLYFNKFYL